MFFFYNGLRIDISAAEIREGIDPWVERGSQTSAAAPYLNVNDQGLDNLQ